MGNYRELGNLGAVYGALKFVWVHIMVFGAEKCNSSLVAFRGGDALVTLRHLRLSLSLTFSYQRKYQYTQVRRTLCQPPTLALSETQFFYVDVSTLSTSRVQYQLRVSRIESFTLQ